MQLCLRAYGRIPLGAGGFGGGNSTTLTRLRL
jgi:hypothetical protein